MVIGMPEDLFAANVTLLLLRPEEFVAFSLMPSAASDIGGFAKWVDEFSPFCFLLC